MTPQEQAARNYCKCMYSDCFDKCRFCLHPVKTQNDTTNEQARNAALEEAIFLLSEELKAWERVAEESTVVSEFKFAAGGVAATRLSMVKIRALKTAPESKPE